MGMDERLADRRDDMGRYFFDQPVPVFVRRLNSYLLVPLDDDWITLKHYLRLLDSAKVSWEHVKRGSGRSG